MRELEESATNLRDTVLKHAAPRAVRIAPKPLLEMTQNDIKGIGKYTFFEHDDGSFSYTKSLPLVQTKKIMVGETETADLQLFLTYNGDVSGKWRSVSDLINIKRAAWGVLSDSLGRGRPPRP